MHQRTQRGSQPMIRRNPMGINPIGANHPRHIPDPLLVAERLVSLRVHAVALAACAEPASRERAWSARDIAALFVVVGCHICSVDIYKIFIVCPACSISAERRANARPSPEQLHFQFQQAQPSRRQERTFPAESYASSPVFAIYKQCGERI